MKRLLIVTLILACISQTTRAQGWWRTYQGEDGYTDIGHCIQRTSDNNYIICGVKDRFTYLDRFGKAWLIKIDTCGDVIWDKYYTDNTGYYLHQIKETTDGGFVSTGVGYEQEWGDDRILAIKTNSAGNMTWKYTYNHWMGGGDEGGFAVTECDDGGFVVTGSELLKLDRNGNQLWLRYYGGYGRGYAVTQTSDGGFIFSGILSEPMGLFKTNEDGEIIWKRGYGNEGIGYSLCKTSDGGYIVGGTANSDILIIKTDVDGELMWSRIYGGDGVDICRSLEPTSDSGYILSGYSSSFGLGGPWDAFFMKIDKDGFKEWIRYWGGPGDDRAYYAVEAFDGGFVIVGSTTSYGAEREDLLVVRTDDLGRLPIYVDTYIYSPKEASHLLSTKPKASFTLKSNVGFYHDVYAHCDIVGLDYHDADRHDSILVEGGFKPWERIDVEFPEWTVGHHISAYRATFYLTSADGTPLPCKPVSVIFFHKSYIEEKQVAAPSLELITSVGSQIILRYSDCPHGFAATIFDDAGRKVDELYSTQQSGTVTWGKEYSPGVYFIRPCNSETKTQKVILIR